MCIRDRLNPELKIVARAHSAAETEHLIRLGANQVFNGEREIALKIIEALKSGESITPTS